MSSISLLTASVTGHLEKVVGGGYVRTETQELQRFAIDGVVPGAAVLPESAEQVAEIVRLLAEEKLSLIACGARTALGIGMPPAQYDVALDISRLRGIAHYDPGDLTVSVDAGTPLTELGKVLAGQGQFVPLAVPRLAQATAAGAVASGLDSPLRHFYGTARDFMIGLEFVEGTGARTKSGGRVVKNVTGYDFHKLMHGALGSLGVITRVNFRTFPLQPSRRGFVAGFANEAAALGFARALADSPLTPALLETFSSQFGELFLGDDGPLGSLRKTLRPWTTCVGYEGSEQVCERYAGELAAMADSASAQHAGVMDEAQFAALFEILREAPILLSEMVRQTVVFRFAVLPADLGCLIRSLRSFAEESGMTAPILIRSRGIIYLALLASDGADVTFIRAMQFWKNVGSLRNQMEIHATILFGPAQWKRELDVWAYGPSSIDLHQRVKKAFDPHSMFAPGRFAGGL